MRFNSINQPKRYAKQKGFTLIEIIVGIVTLSLTMGIILNMIVPAEEESADKLHQIKAAELGQSMLDEVLGRAFDHHSDHAGGVWRCNEALPVVRATCTAETNFGPEDGVAGRLNASENNRSLFNDVDDYHAFSSLVTPTNNALDNSYGSFAVNIDVSYAGTALALTNTQAKLVVVTITTPLGATIEFSGFKSNF